MNPLPRANCPGVAHDGLPGSSAGNELPLHEPPMSVGKCWRAFLEFVQFRQHGAGDALRRGWDFVEGISQPPEYQLEPPRLDCRDVAGLTGNRHARPFRPRARSAGTYRSAATRL